MPSLKDLRNRIASVKATRKITKAMQMVAAAKLRRAQEAAVAARPYSERMSSVIANLGSAMEGKAGAPIAIKGFVRFALGEGIEKATSDFAAEVAAAAKG